MKKLSLDLTSLKVESFELSPQDGAPRGTVRGQSHPYEFTYGNGVFCTGLTAGEFTCQGQNSVCTCPEWAGGAFTYAALECPTVYYRTYCAGTNETCGVSYCLETCGQETCYTCAEC